MFSEKLIVVLFLDPTLVYTSCELVRGPDLIVLTPKGRSRENFYSTILMERASTLLVPLNLTLICRPLHMVCYMRHYDGY